MVIPSYQLNPVTLEIFCSEDNEVICQVHSVTNAERIRNALNAQAEIETGDVIARRWHIDDVKVVVADRELAEEITESQCREVLRRAENNHDADLGINWDVLSEIATQVLGGE